MSDRAPKFDVMAHPSNEKTNLMGMGLIVEGGLAVLALGLAWFGFFEKNQPLNSISAYSSDFWQWIFTCGVAATLPLLVYLLIFHFWTPRFFQPMQEFVDLKLKPMFGNSSILELLILSLLAGICEELFFRWCLQGGITNVLVGRFGETTAIIIGLATASIIFGVCHWVNPAYGITTVVVGGYLGLTMVWTSSWLVPAIAHALFDFVALIYIAKSPVRTRFVSD